MPSIRLALVALLLAIPILGATGPETMPLEAPTIASERLINSYYAPQIPYYPRTTPNFAILMERIAWCESGNDPLAENPNSTADGLYQIIDGTWEYFDCEGDKFNADDNTACAYKIAQDGLHHWDASKHCWSKGLTNQ